MVVLLWRGIYQDLEKMVTVIVALFSLVVIGSLLFLQGTTYAFSSSDLAAGFTFHMPPQGAFVAMALMGSVGATAVELFMYPYWVREKGYPRFIGPDDGSPEWKERYRGWMRVLAMDAGVCTAIALVITCVLPARRFGAVDSAGRSQGHRRSRSGFAHLYRNAGANGQGHLYGGRLFARCSRPCWCLPLVRAGSGPTFSTYSASDLLRMKRVANAGRALYRRRSPLSGFRLFSSGQTRISCCCLDRMPTTCCLFRWPTAFCIWRCARHQGAAWGSCSNWDCS